MHIRCWDLFGELLKISLIYIQHELCIKAWFLLVVGTLSHYLILPRYENLKSRLESVKKYLSELTIYLQRLHGPFLFFLKF